MGKQSPKTSTSSKSSGQAVKKNGKMNGKTGSDKYTLSNSLFKQAKDRKVKDDTKLRAAYMKDMP